MDPSTAHKTRVLPVDASKIGKLSAIPAHGDILDDLEVDLDTKSVGAEILRSAANQLRVSDIPVAFPTETVYGLGADATRSAAVRGIYKAKQRPADNPLIVHLASLKQLRTLLSPSWQSSDTDGDPIPAIYHPLIRRFWPGPLTIILPNPPNSTLAPEVTTGLQTFGARIPRHILALALIKLADTPIAAPSANASTKPSPTAAEHVVYDLDGRIETIIDGGDCDVGVESTVVDGMTQPPLVLRPGGISMSQLRSCPGWERAEIGYRNSSEGGGQPKAPGMKYRHYSPNAPVILYDARRAPPSTEELLDFARGSGKLGLVRTKTWMINPQDEKNLLSIRRGEEGVNGINGVNHGEVAMLGFAGMLQSLHEVRKPQNEIQRFSVKGKVGHMEVYDLRLGPDTASVARGIFGSLRALDREDVDAIVIEGITEDEGETAAAIMNRLRKAAEVKVSH